MEERERVERAEPERALREAQRLAAAARARERPREDVVGLDARALTLRAAGAGERRLEPEAVVDVEEGGLEVGVEAVRDQQALDRADERVLLTREPRLTLGAVEVAEEADELGLRAALGGVALQRDRAAQPAACGLDAGERVEGRDVAGKRGERGAVLAGGRVEPPAAEVELPELDARPRERLCLRAGGARSELHRGDGAGNVAHQLTRVRDAGIRGQARLERRHPVVRAEGLAVAAELDQGVADHAVRARGRR